MGDDESVTSTAHDEKEEKRQRLLKVVEKWQRRLEEQEGKFSNLEGALRAMESAPVTEAEAEMVIRLEAEVERLKGDLAEVQAERETKRQKLETDLKDLEGRKATLDAKINDQEQQNRQ